MSYSSILYVCMFLPAVMLFYAVLPQRHRWKILLAASYLFFYLLSGKLVVYLLISTLSIHQLGLWLDHSRRIYEISRKEAAGADEKSERKAAYTRKKRGILLFAVLFHIGMLAFLKYFDFFGQNANQLLGLLHLPEIVPALKLAVPLGISFYTMQAVSYVTDVYHGKIEADDNLGRLALYMSFFPIIMEGPICRYSETAVSLYEGRQIEYRNAAYGYQRIIWGLFKKLVIADRLSPLVNRIFDGYGDYGGAVVAAGAVLYTFQLYMDFSGCIDITIGTGEIFGVKIPENFRQPFFSRTASEFWRRWHITLGAWLKDYVFYPISLTKFVKNLSKKGKNRFGKHAGQLVTSGFALLGVWLANGLWHGTGWNYIFFGLYYFVLIFCSNIFEPAIQRGTERLGIDRNGIVYQIFQRTKLLIIVFIGEMFFRAATLTAGMEMFGKILTDFRISQLADGTMLRLGISSADYVAVFFGFIAVLTVGLIHERGISIRDRIAEFRLAPRWGIYYGTIFLVIVFGAYGPGYRPVDLIYAGF